ncbi:hypothetical protein [Candidatus Accumulibacter sp. ACC007]|uniref:hypothetical protein n=1 Tax=Candidatus Accumulibacter sp. ACC007 TaxID=2823333 RepID=UPI0025C0D5E4|nr:hypothetical protein [Candidatus Accumulibacter sp. ACC007]
MTIHLYFSLVPEALIASMLEPEQFGQYYSTGHSYKSKGQAIFFELDPKFRHEFFNIDEGFERCVAHPDGTPKNSVYISVYRVLEHIPVSALGKLYLGTAYGQTLGLSRADSFPAKAKGLHMYQDLAPINSLVVSAQDPKTYYEKVTSQPNKFIRFPGLCFVELELGALATDPGAGAVGDLPYSFVHHLREALLEVDPAGKQSKLVHRVHSLEFPYRMIKNGIYIGNGSDLVFYKMPSHEALRQDHSTWWRSCNL